MMGITRLKSTRPRVLVAAFVHNSALLTLSWLLTEMNIQLDQSMTRTVNVLIVGVGGQGVVMISRILAELCQASGHDVKQSEVHGMAKRGGVVFSHLRFGEKVWSPTIPEGEADILVSMEWAESLRWLSWLNPDDGIFITDTKQIVPPFACRERTRWADQNYIRTTPAEILPELPQGYAVDATAIAMDAGNARVSNTVLLGVLSTALAFEESAWRSLIETSVPPKTVAANLLAFEKGRSWVAEQPSAGAVDGSAGRVINEVTPHAAREVDIEINEAWCKGCDICVKVCPERCLRMNQRQIVEITDKALCTGCHLCEWLCPDFAIRIEEQRG